MSHLKTVWQKVLDSEHSNLQLLEMVNLYPSILYLWQADGYHEDPPSFCVKIIESLDDDLRDESDDLYPEYQPVYLSGEADEIKSQISAAGVTPMALGNEPRIS